VIVFSRFRVTNAGPFKKIDLDLNKRGLVRLTGPNGIGKSSAFHLFTQTIYSTNPNGAKKTDLQFEHDENFLIEITFTRNQSEYVAAQAIKSKSLSPEGKKYGTGVYLFRDGQDISMHRDPDTQKLIRQTLGWSLEEWYGYVYLAQKSTHTLIEGTRSERQTYLSALFNLTPLDVLAKHFSEQEKEIAEKIEIVGRCKEEYNTKISLLAGRTQTALQQKLQELDSNIEHLEESLEVFQAKQVKYERAQSLLNEISDFPDTREVPLLDNLLSDFRGLQAEYEAYRKIKRGMEEKLNDLVEVPNTQIPLDFQHILRSPDYDEVGLRQELSALDQIQKSLQGVQAPTDPHLPEDYESVLASPDIDSAAVLKTTQTIEGRPAAPKEQRPLPEQIEIYNSLVLSLTESIASLKAEIKPLEFGGSVCTTCGTQLDCEDRSEKLQSKKEELAQFQIDLKKTQADLNDSLIRDRSWRAYDALGPDRSHELPALKVSLALFDKKTAYKKLREQKEAFKKYEQKLEELKKIPPLKEKLSLYQKKKEYLKLQEQAAQYQKYIEEKTNLENELQKLSLQGLKDHSKEIEALQQEHTQALKLERMEAELLKLKGSRDQSAKIQAVKTELASAQTLKGSLQQEITEIETLSTSIQDLQGKIDAGEPLYVRQKLYQILAKGYGKAGQLRERQLAKFSHYLEQALLAHTARQLPQHRFKIVVDDGIDILASKNGGKPYDVKFMSGGEKGALSVAFLFALDDLLPPDRRTSIKICDEVESAFDKERRADFIAHTLPELRKRAETVIVISHASEANDSLFDATWEVKNGSIVEKVSERREFEFEEMEL
jgi:DNA repair exonuclease SbcCD ATPase subunit